MAKAGAGRSSHRLWSLNGVSGAKWWLRRHDVGPAIVSSRCYCSALGSAGQSCRSMRAAAVKWRGFGRSDAASYVSVGCGSRQPSFHGLDSSGVCSCSPMTASPRPSWCVSWVTKEAYCPCTDPLASAWSTMPGSRRAANCSCWYSGAQMAAAGSYRARYRAKGAQSDFPACYVASASQLEPSSLLTLLLW